MRIVFMGTPDFSVPALKALMKDHEIVGVYSQPPKPSGRGKKITPQPVHQVAEANGLKVFTPLKFSKNPEAIEELKALNADVAVVCAYGLILPQAVLDIPKLGCINIHASLLPRFRGASPIHAAIYAGDKETGVCVMQMEAGLDIGPVMMRKAIPITKEDTAGTMHDKLAELGAELICKTLVQSPLPTAVPQPEEGSTYAHKLTKESGHIDWNATPKEVDQRIRACTPWPSSYAMLNEDKIFIGGVEILENTGSFGKPGEVLNANLEVACKEGKVRILKLQKPGKKMMTAKEFLNGQSIEPGSILG